MEEEKKPESIELVFQKTPDGNHVAQFPFGEYLIVGPTHNMEYVIAFTVNMEGENKSFELPKKGRTFRAAKYIAQMFHEETMIPQIVESFENADKIQNENSQAASSTLV